MSKELTDVKAEIKRWEHTFKDAHGREPTRDDIKANPVIGAYNPAGQVSVLSQTIDVTEVEKYKLYNKLKKKTEERPDARPSRKSPRTPSPASSRSAIPPTTIIGSKARPTTSSTSLETKNPFSPVKKKNKLPDEPARTVWNPFMTPVKSAPAPTSTPAPDPVLPNMFQQPGRELNTVISKARKRLRGDSVSPSPPQRNKQIRVESIMENTVVNREEEEEGFIEESPAKPTANGKSFQPLFNDISSQPSTSTENRGRTFMKAKTISSGLFGGAIRDNKNITQDFLPIDSRSLTKGKGKAIETTVVMPTIKKRKTLPGPKGLIPSKDNLFEEQSNITQLPSPQVSSSRKRTISKVARETAKQPPLESNEWNLLPPSPPAEGKKRWHNATTVMKKQKLLGKARHDDDEEEEESAAETDNVDIVGWHEAGKSRQVHDLNMEIDPELRIQLHPGASATRTKSRSPEPEIFDVDLPEHMVNMLSLSPKGLANEKKDEDLAKRVVQGRRRGGTEVWGPGEFGGESEGSDGRRNEEQDDWEGEGVPWEIAEL